MKAVGFIVTGVSPQRVAAIRERSLKRSEEIVAATNAGTYKPRPLKLPEDRVLRGKIVFGPTHIRAAADDAAALARKTGWLSVEVKERDDA